MKRYLISILLIIIQIPSLSQVKTRLSDNVNRFQPSIVPVINYESDELFFDRKFNIDNIGGAKDKDDIWRSIKNGKYWTLAQRLNSTFNSISENVLFNFLPDSRTILYYDGADKNPFKIAQISNDSLIKIDCIKLKNYKNESKNFYGFLSFDAKHILLAIDKSDSKGNLDLYVSHCNNNGEWSDLINLGAVINSNGIETSPFLANDGKTLYFSSNREGGNGGLDVYISKRLDESWTNWSKPENLGKLINSNFDDYSFYLSPNAENGFLVSEDTIAGRPGIYSIEKLPKSFQPDEYLILEGKINVGNFSINDYNSNKDFIFNPKKSSYRLIINKENSTDTVIFKSKNYEIDTLIIPKYSGITTYIKDVNLKPAKEQKISLYFENNSDKLADSEFKELQKFTESIEIDVLKSIKILGFANEKGNEKLNLLLSNNRANKIKKEIEKKLKKNIKFEINGMGAIKDGNSENPLNRRVDIIIEK